MPEFEFTPSAADSNISASYHKRDIFDRFYDKRPYFRFGETVVGTLRISGFSDVEGLVLSEALVSGTRKDSYDYDCTDTDCVNPTETEILEALRAIDNHDTFETPVIMSRSKQYHAVKPRQVPPDLVLPEPNFNSLVGNLQKVQKLKTAQLKEIIGDPKEQFSGVSTNERSNLLLAHGLVAGALITQLTTELTIATSNVHNLTPASLASLFGDLPGVSDRSVR